MKNKMKTNMILTVFQNLTTFLFPLITFPYISRVLQAENYGKVNYAISLVSYFTMFASFGLFDYGVREGSRLKDKQEEKDLFANQIFTINVIFSVIVYLVFLVFININSGLTHYRNLLIIQGFTIIRLPLGVDWVLAFSEEYFFPTVKSIIIRTLSLILFFLVIKKPEDYVKYAAVLVASIIISNILNFLYSRKYIKLKLTSKINFKKHISKMAVFFFHTLTLSIYVNSDIIMLGIFKGDTDVGYYSMAANIYALIKNLFSGVVLVTIPQISYNIAEKNIEKLKDILTELYRILLIFGIPCVVGIFMISDSIIGVIGGNGYAPARVPLRLLSISLFFAINASFYCSALLVPMGREKTVTLCSAISAIVNILLNLFIVPRYGIAGAAYTTCISEIIMFGVPYFILRKQVEINVKKDLVDVLSGSVIISVICFAVNMSGIAALQKCVLSVTLSAFSYFVVLYIRKNVLVTEIFDKLKIKRNTEN